MANKNKLLTQQDTNRILRGQHGRLWFNGKLLATLQKIECKMTGNYEEINVCGDPATYQLYNGWSGEGTMEYLKMDSEITRLIVEAFVSGEMPVIEIITLLENPATGKRERCRVSEITVTEAMVAAFEKKSIITDSVPFKFADFEYLETIA